MKQTVPVTLMLAATSLFLFWPWLAWGWQRPTSGVQLLLWQTFCGDGTHYCSSMQWLPPVLGMLLFLNGWALMVVAAGSITSPK